MRKCYKGQSHNKAQKIVKPVVKHVKKYAKLEGGHVIGKENNFD